MATKNNKLTGNALAYNSMLQNRYNKAIQYLIDEMIKETELAINDLFKTNEAKEYFSEDASVSSQARIITNKLMEKFERLFNLGGQEAAKDMTNATNKASERAVKQSLKSISEGLTLKTDFMTEKMQDIMKAITTQNAALIKTIAPYYLGKVQAEVMKSITTGRGLADLVPFLQKQKHITKRHAQLMALDQTRKAYTHLNAARFEKLGIKKFEWVHSGGGQKPRYLHQKVLNGKIFEIANPPIIDEKTGERGLPGDAINCKCVMKPVIDFDG